MSSPGRKIRRVVVTGSECTGKTTLAEALAAHYRVAHVPEFARIFVQRQGRAPAVEDVEAIARGQIALENETLMRNLEKADSAGSDPFFPAEEGSLLILDTDLLSTIVYSRHYFGDCPAWIDDELAKRAGDLYLLAGIDAPWVADGAFRDRGDRREEMQALFARELRGRNLPCAELSGPHDARLAAGLAAIAGLLR